MASDFQERKPLLYSDLFKPRKTTTAPESNIATSKMETSSSSSSWTQSLFSCDSSSSGFSTPLYSDLGSFGSEDADFIAELTRQMAECMLQEDDEGIAAASEDCQASGYSKDNDEGNEKNCGSSRMPPIPNQGRVSKRRGRRGKKGQSTQTEKKQLQKTEQYIGGEWGIGYARNGYATDSSMQALFLGGSGFGSRSMATGTGVFLPRVTSVTSGSTEPKKKSGCPMVLIPTRVLQVLELHFNRVQVSTTPPSDTSPNYFCPAANNIDCEIADEGSRSDGDSQLENIDEDEMQLPQEWTY